MSISGEPTWLSSGSGSILAWVHGPEGAAPVRGAVVLAPPLAREQVISYRSMRVLAMMLAEQGWVAVRFAFRGTGESEDLPERSESIGSWLEDLDAALVLARAASGAEQVHGIGLRLGAALLATSDNAAWGMRLLWEPVGGREFVRLHSALRRLALLSSATLTYDGVELGGTFFTNLQANAVRRLSSVKKQALPTGAAIVEETDRTTSRLLYATVSLHARVPLESLQALIARLPVPTTPWARPDWKPRLQALMKVEGESWPVVEELHTLGGRGIPAVLTRPATTAEAGMPFPGAIGSATPPREAGLFIAASAEPKDGVTALWVQAGRRLAAHGTVSARVERIGCGDMGHRDDIRDPNPHTQEVIDGVVEASLWLASTTGLPITGIGLCSGAWSLAEAAPAGNLKRVLMINNIAWRRHQPYWATVHSKLPTDGDAGEIIGPDEVKPDQGLGLKARIRDLLRNYGPYWLWLKLGQLHVTNVPEIVLEAASRTSSIELHLGQEDINIFQSDHGEIGLTRLLRAGRNISLMVHDDFDHALLTESSRRQTLAIIDDAFGVAKWRTLSSEHPSASV